jgi:hypothetical protein
MDGERCNQVSCLQAVVTGHRLDGGRGGHFGAGLESSPGRAEGGGIGEAAGTGEAGGTCEGLGIGVGFMVTGSLYQ